MEARAAVQSQEPTLARKKEQAAQWTGRKTGANECGGRRRGRTIWGWDATFSFPAAYLLSVLL